MISNGQDVALDPFGRPGSKRVCTGLRARLGALLQPFAVIGRRATVGALFVCLVNSPAIHAAAAQEAAVPAEVQAALSPAQLESYRAYLVARAAFERQLDMYWALIEERRDLRRRKFAARQPFTRTDYVTEYPPQYTGPPLTPDIAAIVQRTEPPRPPAEELPNLADFLRFAEEHYGFRPTRVSEREFKRRYAAEALAAGLTAEQVVMVYALETGGRGTYDMQAGINPITKQGRPISSALGYAQLLNANSVSELVKHGDDFISQLEVMASQPAVSADRRAELIGKAAVLRRMLRVARSVPNQWSRHVELGRTPRGSGIHALNLDADIGPKLQVLKLKGIVEFAARDGINQLSGPELELMNLAGPRTGLEMMQPLGSAMPTSNFFSRRGYYRNTIVRGKTGADLLKSIEERIAAGLRQQGSQDFLAAFREVAGSDVSMSESAPKPRPAMALPPDTKP